MVSLGELFSIVKLLSLLGYAVEEVDRQANAIGLPRLMRERRRAGSRIDSLRVRPLFAFQNLSLVLFVFVIDMRFPPVLAYIMLYYLHTGW